MKSIIYLKDVKKAIQKKFSYKGRLRIAHMLSCINAGLMPSPLEIKHMPEVGADVYELRLSEEQHRIFFTTKFNEAYYVLHVFRKKLQQTSQTDIQIGKDCYSLLLNHHRKQQKRTTQFTKGTGNVFNDLGLSNNDARVYQFRSFLMINIMKYIKIRKISNIVAAEDLGVTQQRITNLVHSRIDLFSTGMLLDMLERAGFCIFDNVEDDIEKLITKQSGTTKRHLNRKHAFL